MAAAEKKKTTTACVSVHGNILGFHLTDKGQTPEEAHGYCAEDADEGENEGDDDDA